MDGTHSEPSKCLLTRSVSMQRSDPRISQPLGLYAVELTKLSRNRERPKRNKKLTVGLSKTKISKKKQGKRKGKENRRPRQEIGQVQIARLHDERVEAFLRFRLERMEVDRVGKALLGPKLVHFGSAHTYTQEKSFDQKDRGKTKQKGGVQRDRALRAEWSVCRAQMRCREAAVRPARSAAPGEWRRRCRSS